MEQGSKPDNLRAEYAAVSAKLNQLPSFRFALAGFYVAGVGVVASIEGLSAAMRRGGSREVGMTNPYCLRTVRILRSCSASHRKKNYG